jgi:hypothetical protein
LTAIKLSPPLLQSFIMRFANQHGLTFGFVALFFSLATFRVDAIALQQQQDQLREPLEYTCNGDDGKYISV